MHRYCRDGLAWVSHFVVPYEWMYPAEEHCCKEFREKSQVILQNYFKKILNLAHIFGFHATQDLLPHKIVDESKRTICKQWEQAYMMRQLD